MSGNQERNKNCKEEECRESRSSFVPYREPWRGCLPPRYGNDGFNRLEQMQNMPPEDLRNILRQLPDRERFRKNLVNLLCTATSLLRAFDDVIHLPEDESSPGTASENRVFVGRMQYGQDNVPNKELVLPAERDFSKKAWEANNSNDIKYEASSKSDLYSTRDGLVDALSHLSTLSSQGSIYLESKNYLPLKSDLASCPQFVNPTYNFQSASGKQENISNSSMPYEGNKPLFHETLRFLGTQSAMPRQRTGAEHSENSPQHPNVVMGEIKMFRETYVASIDNANNGENRISKSGNDKEIAGSSNTAGGMEEDDDDFTSVESGGSDKDSGEFQEYNDQLDMKKRKRYCRCKSHNKNKLRLKVLESLAVPHNTPHDLKIEGTTKPIARDRTGHLRELEFLLTPSTIKSKLRTASSWSSHKTGGSTLPNISLAKSVPAVNSGEKVIRETVLSTDDDFPQTSSKSHPKKKKGA